MKIPAKLTRRHDLISVVLFLLLLFLLSVTRPERAAGLREESPATVAAIGLKRGDLTPTRQVSGLLQPVRSAGLRFEVGGQVVERRVEPGQTVRTGEILLRLDQGDLDDRFELAGAMIEQERLAIERDRNLLAMARDKRKLQESEVARLEKLGTSSMASGSQLGSATQQLLTLQSEEVRLSTSVASAGARLGQRRAELSQAERNLARSRLRAPFDGVVNSVHYQEGDFVTTGQQAIEVIDTAQLDLYLEVDAALAAARTPGERIEVTVAGGVRPAEVIAIQRAPDPQSHSYALRLRLDGTGLLSGQLAQLELPLATQVGVLRVPVEALLREEGRSYLFLIEEVEGGERLRRVEVVSGLRHRGEVVVQPLEGGEALVEGAPIVARDVAALSDGQTVRLQSPDVAHDPNDGAAN